MRARERAVREILGSGHWAGVTLVENYPQDGWEVQKVRRGTKARRVVPLIQIHLKNIKGQPFLKVCSKISQGFSFKFLINNVHNSEHFLFRNEQLYHDTWWKVIANCILISEMWKKIKPPKIWIEPNNIFQWFIDPNTLSMTVLIILVLKMFVSILSFFLAYLKSSY